MKLSKWYEHNNYEFTILIKNIKANKYYYAELEDGLTSPWFSSKQEAINFAKIMIDSLHEASKPNIYF